MSNCISSSLGFCLVSTNSPALIPQVMETKSMQPHVKNHLFNHIQNRKQATYQLSNLNAFSYVYCIHIMFPSFLHRLYFLSHDFCVSKQVTNSLLVHFDVQHPATSPLKVQHALMVPQCFQPVDLFQTNAPHFGECGTMDHEHVSKGSFNNFTQTKSWNPTSTTHTWHTGTLFVEDNFFKKSKRRFFPAGIHDGPKKCYILLWRNGAEVPELKDFCFDPNQLDGLPSCDAEKPQ